MDNIISTEFKGLPKQNIEREMWILQIKAEYEKFAQRMEIEIKDKMTKENESAQ